MKKINCLSTKLFLATTITGTSIKASLENAKESAREFRKLIHTKEKRKAWYWPLRQFQANIASFILIQPLPSEELEATQTDITALAEIREALHGHHYLLFSAFNTIFDILKTNITLLNGQVIAYPRCATLLTYCFASIDFSSNRGRTYAVEVLKELLQLHFCLSKNQPENNLVPVLVNVLAGYFPQFQDELKKDKETTEGKDKKGKKPMQAEDEGSSQSAVVSKKQKKSHQSHKTVARAIIDIITNLLIHLKLNQEAQNQCFALLQYYGLCKFTSKKKADYEIAKAVFNSLDKLIDKDKQDKKQDKDIAETMKAELMGENQKAAQAYQEACKQNKQPITQVIKAHPYIRESSDLAREAWRKRFPLDDDIRDLSLYYKSDVLDDVTLRKHALIELGLEQAQLQTKIKTNERVSVWGKQLFERISKKTPRLEQMPSEIQWEIRLREHYRKENCCYVRLLFERKEHIKNCFVNLTIVKQAKQREQVKQSLENKEQTPGLNRERYLNWYEDIHRDQGKERVEIADIFKERKGEQETRKRFPKRILVHGWAGIGKTTLLRKIAFEWAAKNLWFNKFKLVLWIRLRNLNKDNIASKTHLQDILEIELYDGTSASKKVSEKLLADIIEYINAKGAENVLFLLDGFDELDTSRAIANVIDKILDKERRWYVIGTSRPTVNIEDKFDSILETIGFTDKNINVYIGQFFKDEADKAKQLIEFLNTNPSIYGLAHIPINLELICSVFGKDMPKKAFANMT